MIEPSLQEMITSLRCETCPACRAWKRSTNSLCGRCYHLLPREMQISLYHTIGSGYEGAIAEAFRHLGRDTFHLPGPTPATLTSATAVSVVRKDDQLSLFDRGPREGMS